MDSASLGLEGGRKESINDTSKRGGSADLEKQGKTIPFGARPMPLQENEVWHLKISESVHYMSQVRRCRQRKLRFFRKQPRVPSRCTLRATSYFRLPEPNLTSTLSSLKSPSLLHN